MGVKIGAAIRAVRESRGLTQAYLADEAGIDRGNMSRIERDEQSIPLERLEAVARVLDIHVYELVRLAEQGRDERRERWDQAYRRTPPDQLDALLRLLEPPTAATQHNHGVPSRARPSLARQIALDAIPLRVYYCA